MQKNLLSDSVDSRCTVFSKENQFLFSGQLSHYDAVNDKLRVDARQLSSISQFMDSGDWIKLQIKRNGDNHLFLLVEGIVEQAIHNFFFLTPHSVREKEEERTYFRQNVMKPSVIAFVNHKAAGHSCTIVDISATGISVQSDAIYEVGDILWIFNQRIRENGPVHNLEFQVVRKHSLQNCAYRNFYGCKFVNLSPQTQDKLFSDIFALQSTSLRSSQDK